MLLLFGGTLRFVASCVTTPDCVPVHLNMCFAAVVHAGLQNMTCAACWLMAEHMLQDVQLQCSGWGALPLSMMQVWHPQNMLVKSCCLLQDTHLCH